jgi:hypothetical protein
MDPDQAARLRERRDKVSRHVADVVEAGRGIARMLEARDQDSGKVLMFLGRVEDDRTPVRTLRADWLKLKSRLERFRLRSCGRIHSPQVPPAPEPAGSVFSEADYKRAQGVLEMYLQDYPWEQGENHLTTESLLGALQAKGITYTLATGLLRQLIDIGVFQPSARMQTTGTSAERASPTRGERSRLPETTHCLVTSRERWSKFLADRACPTETTALMAPGDQSIVTKPNSPLPPEPLIQAAMRDVPCTLADMDNQSDEGQPGERIVQYNCLVIELVQKRHHGKAASEWAIHRLVQQGKLTATYSRVSFPAVVGGRRTDLFESTDLPVGPNYPSEIYECLDLQQARIGSTTALWQWWHELEHRWGTDIPTRAAVPLTDESAAPTGSADRPVEPTGRSVPGQVSSKRKVRPSGDLSNLQREILKILDRAGACDAVNRMSSSAIAGKIKGTSPESVRQAARHLVKKGYLRSQKYTSGGYWLTRKSLKRSDQFN